MTDAPLTEQDREDLDSLENPPAEHSLLEIWSLVLDNVSAVAKQPIPANVAAKVVASWPFLTFQETAQYHLIYHQILEELGDDLSELIRKHPEAIGWVGDDDAEHNHALYREILVTWHNQLDSYEEDWRAGDSNSHIWIAAIADTRAFIFSQMGLAGHLDAIGFQMSDGEFLEAVVESREERGE